MTNINEPKNLGKTITTIDELDWFSAWEEGLGKRIIRILDGLLTKEQQAKEATETVVEKIDRMKNSILVRAFRGKPGPNNLCKETALKLLEKII